MKNLILKTNFVFILTILAPLTQAKLSDYEYYSKFLAKIQKSQNKDLKDTLYQAISNNKTLSYKTARRHMFGDLFLKKTSSGYTVTDTYCDKSFGEDVGVGPDQIPDHTVLNCEHTWPQSRFSSRDSKSTQKGDLHHLFPTDSKANSTRGNIPFGDVNGQAVNGCPIASRGDDINDGINSFEPPKFHKGNVARALFYFAVRYQISIDETQEEYLREWHSLDPVDADELDRNTRIEAIQGNRNPFIDGPELVDQIDNF